MARPKLQNNVKKIPMNLTVSPEIKKMAMKVSQANNISASELFAKMIEKEYKKLVKKGEETAILKGQMSIDDLD